nr:PREDICTED: polymeric immunoglobulin receptor [Struthio camelus australis]XP_009670496.1 PREDICTED: polymeric immunoglobulin receptor [Struthio camelus australis]XP_009670497.1 PREDICTED: polymeric immunoglobulin receptor [Struthio camelus australis]
MTFLVLIFLLSLLHAESARSKYPPKEAVLNPVFGPREVNGLLEGSVTVKCFYPQTKVNRHDRKYWCRESTRSCLTIVSSNGYTARGYQDRVSITDYPEQGIFLINMSRLALGDRGTYRCGLGLNGRGLSFQVKVDVSEGPNIPEEADLFYVELQGSVTMSCSFGEQYGSERKYLCKMEKSGCRNVIDTYGKVDDEYAGRILLSNQDTAGSYSIMITQLSWEDSGLYLCGVGVYGETGETKELDLHVYEGTDVPQGKHTIFGVKGGSVTAECHYNPRERASEKYWCKWRKNGCFRIIGSSGFVSDLYEGRVAMYDDPENGTFTIILNQLVDNDKGYYWCMTDENREKKSSKELKIIDGEPSLAGKKEVEVNVGSQVHLACSYPCKYYSYEKYWCKWTSTGCTPVTASDQGHLELDVDCNTANKTLLLNFDPVALTDQGWYWCGVKHNGIFGETMAVQLRVVGARVAVESAANPSPELLDVEAPGSDQGGVIPQGRASSNAGAGSPAAAGSPEESHGPNVLPLVIGPVGAVLLVLATVFAIFKYRQIKRSDLVSVGSYRTNISMSDFESAKEYGANDNACMKETQETQIGGDEFITTASKAESAAEAKKVKRGK